MDYFFYGIIFSNNKITSKKLYPLNLQASVFFLIFEPKQIACAHQYDLSFHYHPYLQPRPLNWRDFGFRFSTNISKLGVYCGR